MTANILIILLSFALLVYWIRYTCLLLVKETTESPMTSFPLFSFPTVRARLKAGQCGVGLRQALNRDYEVLRYLIGQNARVGFEAKLLVWDYRLMRCWSALAGTFSPAQGSAALAEMGDVLAAIATRLQGPAVPINGYQS